ncbi:MAG TPA: hypothetical protein VHO69_11470 [Phototrophicaceae bacterium]|nr:hypothetical protein [Phototrophicaceae bacterium]
MRRTSLLIIGLVSLFFILAGMRPAALPFFNAETRYSDAVVSHWPNAVYLRESVLAGQFPVWRETLLAGQPFAANPLNKTAYPLQWLALLLPPALHLNLMIGLHLLMAGVGMWRWARALDFSEAAAALSTLAYVLAPRLLGHLGAGHLDIVYALAWSPWLMLAVRQVTADARVERILQLALVAALLLLADVRVSLFMFAAAGITVLVQLGRTRPWKAVQGLALAGGLTILLTLALTVPLLVWSPYTTRAGLSIAEAGTLAFQPGNWLGLILFPVPPGIETLAYVGLPVLVLAVIGWWSSGQWGRIGGAAGLLLIMLYALGANGLLWPLLGRLIPGLLWFRVPSRIWLVVALFAPLLAGYGLDRLTQLVERIRSSEVMPQLARLRLGAAGLTVMVVAFGVFALLVLDIPDAIGAGALIAGGGAGLLLLLALNGKVASRRLAGLFLTLIALDLAWFGLHWVTWRGPEAWLEPQRALAEKLVEDKAARIYSPTYSLEQQTAAVYHLRLFGGVDPFQLRGTAAAIEQGSGVYSSGYSVVMPPVTGVKGDDLSQANREAVINTEVLAEWDVSHVVAAYSIEHPRLRWLDTIDSIYIYQNQDYQPKTSANAIPDWPPGWPDLPSEPEVTRLNQLTVISWVLSMTAFGVCLVVWGWLYYRKRPRRDAKKV